MCNTMYNHMLKTPLSECTYGILYSKYTGRKKRGRVLVQYYIRKMENAFDMLIRPIDWQSIFRKNATFTSTMLEHYASY